MKPGSVKKLGVVNPRPFCPQFSMRWKDLEDPETTEITESTTEMQSTRVTVSKT